MHGPEKKMLTAIRGSYLDERGLPGVCSIITRDPEKIDVDCETGVGDESGCPEPPDSADAMVTAEVRGRRRETSVADNTPVEADTRSGGDITQCV